MEKLSILGRAAGAVKRAADWIGTGGAPQQSLVGTINESPADGITPGTIDDAFRGLGSYGSASLDRALRYPAVYRACNLIATMVAESISNGGLRVIHNRSGDDETEKHEDLLDLITGWPNGWNDAVTFWQDCIYDYCTDGNALIHAERRGAGNRVWRLRRCHTQAAQVEWPADGAHVYRIIYEDAIQRATSQGRVKMSGGMQATFAGPKPDRATLAAYETIVPAADMIHCRFPLPGSSYRRAHMAESPLYVLRYALEIGLYADDYVRWYFRNGGAVKSNIALAFKDSQMSAQQRKEIHSNILKYAKDATGRLPLVTYGDADIKQLHHSPQDADAKSLREYQAIQIADVYGIPAPLIGINTTSWGSGLEQLKRLAYQFGFRQHFTRILGGMSKTLLPKGKRFAIDETDYLRGDWDTIGKLVSSTIGGPNGGPVLTRDELRKVMGFPKEPSGEFVSYNPMGDESDNA